MTRRAGLSIACALSELACYARPRGIFTQCLLGSSGSAGSAVAGGFVPRTRGKVSADVGAAPMRQQHTRIGRPGCGETAPPRPICVSHRRLPVIGAVLI